MKNTLLLLASLTLLISCAKKENEFVYTTVDEKFELLRQQQLLISTQATEESFELNNDGEQIEEKISPVVNGFCEMISKDNFESPFEFEKNFSTSLQFNNYLNSVRELSAINDKCLGKKVILDKFPIILVEYELEKSSNLYVSFRVDSSLLVKSMYPFFKSSFNIRYHDIAMRDEVTISTLSFELENKKAKTIFIKTPYFHTDSNSYYMYQAVEWIEKGYNVVLQSNRGSHASGGTFKWLHELNANDSEDTILWIAKQPFSSGKVISYGVSYDGFNALASSVNSPKGLESVIACSAPSNARTDSFTAGQTIEAWLLNYIANRENPDQINLFGEKIRYLLEKNTSLEDFDNILYSRDIADWQDMMNARKSGDLAAYWKERSVLEGIEKTTVPIFHVAGTDNDQDGRDTILAFDHLKKNAVNPKLHHLYIHHEGHGCGDFIKELGEDFLAGKFEIYASEYRRVSTSQKIEVVSSKRFNKRSLTLSHSSDDVKKFIINDRYDIFDQKEAILFFTANEDLLINGKMELEVEGIWDMFKSNVTVSIFKLKNQQFERIHWMLSSSSRSSLNIDSKVDFPTTLKLTLPPVLFEIKEEESIVVVLGTNVADYLDIFMEQRNEYYSQNPNSGVFRVLDTGKNKLNVSVEIKEEVLP